MSAEKKVVTDETASVAAAADDAVKPLERSEKILQAKELYSRGSRNYLVKSYNAAADDLSEVCSLYVDLYGELSDELGMPYLLYAKSLIALALDENKVIDVPDEQEEDDDDDDDDAEDDAETNGHNNATASTSTSKATNGTAAKLSAIKEIPSEKKADEADSTADDVVAEKTDESKAKTAETKTTEEADVVSSSADKVKEDKSKNSNATNSNTTTAAAVVPVVVDGEKPSTSNGEATNADDEEDNEAATSLQMAWEILELAAKIFSHQGLSGLPNLAEVQTELANIEFENNILDGAREDYEKALKIYGDLPPNYRRAMAEIHYKIGLTYLMQQANKEGAESLKEACHLIEGEIEEIKNKPDINEKDKNNIQDMEETKQEIWAKISEIEDTQAQQIAEVRAALDSYIKPIAENAAGAGTSSSAAAGASTSSGAITSSSSASAATTSKPTDISHLIKRKKPEDTNSEAEAAETASPAKRPAL